MIRRTGIRRGLSLGVLTLIGMMAFALVASAALGPGDGAKIKDEAELRIQAKKAAELLLWDLD